LQGSDNGSAIATVTTFKRDDSMTMPHATATDRPAEDEPLDCPVLQVSPEVYAEFLAMLEAPPNPNERL
jgi:uncharacterized protein (DUF1778 family)